MPHLRGHICRCFITISYERSFIFHIFQVANYIQNFFSFRIFNSWIYLKHSIVKVQSFYWQLLSSAACSPGASLVLRIFMFWREGWGDIILLFIFFLRPVRTFWTWEQYRSVILSNVEHFINCCSLSVNAQRETYDIETIADYCGALLSKLLEKLGRCSEDIQEILN